jgi:hypothetical protein
MPFSIDFLDDGRVLEWDATTDGAVATERNDYTPRFYVTARDPDADIDLTALQSVYDQHPDVVATEIVTRRPGFRRDEEPVSRLTSPTSTVSPRSRARHASLTRIRSGTSPVSTSTSRESFGTVSRKTSIRRRRASCRRSGSASR